MPFPTTVDAIVDAPPVTANTVIHASQVLGPQRVTVGPTMFNIKSDQYGAKGDGSTDDAAAITAAFTAASALGGGMVVAPPSSAAYAINSRLVVPNKVQLVGGGRGTGSIKALGTFPTSTELIRLGDVGASSVFACRLENIALDCSGVTGSTGVYSNCLNEQCGVSRCLVLNYGSYGIRLDNPIPVTGTNQNYWIDDIECNSGSGTPAGAVGLAITNTTLQPIRSISRATVNASGFTQLTKAVQIDGVVGGRFQDIHIENAVTGILVGSVTLCGALTFGNIIGATSGNVTTLMTWSNATASQGLVAIGLTNPTNQLNDQIDGLLFNSGSTVLGLHTLGDGTTKSLLNNVVGIPVRLGNDLGSVGAAPTLGALQTNISTQSIAGNDLHGKVTLLTGGTGPALGSNVAQVNFARTKSAAPVVVLMSQGGGNNGQSPWYSSNQTTGAFNISTNANLLANTTYIVGYVVLGT